MARRGRTQRGTTLLEVLTGTALTAILLAVAVPNFRALATPYEASSAARLMASDCAAARMRAIARNQRHRIRVDADAETWVIEAEQAPGSWVAVGETRSAASGVTLGAAAPADPMFNTRGMLAGTVSMTVSHGDSTRTVTINVLGQATIG